MSVKNIDIFMSYLSVQYKKESTQNNLKIIKKEQDDFLSRYPLETLDELTVEEYDSIGNEYSFMNMIENKTKSISLSSLMNNSNKYFYQERKTKEYVQRKPKNIKFYKEDSIDNNFKIYITRMKKCIESYDNYEINKRPDNFLLGTSIIRSKILFLYYKDKFITISKIEKLQEIASFFGLDTIAKYKNNIEINLGIVNYFSNLDNNIFKTYSNKVIFSRYLYNFFWPLESYLEEDVREEKIIDDGDKFTKNKNVEIPEISTIKQKRRTKKGGKVVYRRDQKQRIIAMKRSDYKCQININHLSFISVRTEMKYLETHHFIPMSAQDEIENSLDNFTNIITLCSDCHNFLHYGLPNEKKKYVIDLFENLKDDLNKSGIHKMGSLELTHNDVLRYYDIQGKE